MHIHATHSQTVAYNYYLGELRESAIHTPAEEKKAVGQTVDFWYTYMFSFDISYESYSFIVCTV